LESSNDYTLIRPILEQEWGWPSASASLSATADEFGSNPTPDVVRPSSSPSRGEFASFVVLIEDNPADVFLVREAISAHDLNIDLHLMEDGEQAIRFIAELDANPHARCPLLFLLDLNLPKTSGVEVLAYIRRSKKCASSPVLIITSSDAHKDRVQSTALGATAYFRKPSGYEAYLKLGEVIQQLLT